MMESIGVISEEDRQNNFFFFSSYYHTNSCHLCTAKQNSSTLVWNVNQNKFV